MDTKANNMTIDPSDTAEESLSTLWLRRIGRVLLPVMSLTIAIQPVAIAAPSPSLLSQEPRFLDVSVESNVMFIMDDSLSMDDIRLPVPAALNPGEAVGGTVTTRNGLVVERVNEWIFRSSTLNPLYYNPAITYTPWNDNGRAGAAGRFQKASTAINTLNGFREGLVRHDVRYAGPNYTSAGFGSGDRLTTTGANPPAVPGYLSLSRPADGGFTGTVNAGRNQDIFSSPFVFVTNLTQICLSGAVSQISTAQPFTARTTSAQPSTVRVSNPQPSTPRPYAARTTTTITSSPRPSTPQVYAARASSAVTTTARASSAQPFTPRAFSARTTSAQTSTVRPTEYRIETGACGNWGPWIVATVPPSGLCSDPNSEGGVRVALVQSQPAACPAGTTASGGNCISCPTGSSINGSSCLSNCAAGTTAGTVGGNPVCLSACAAGTTAGTDGGGNPACFSPCPAGTTDTGLVCLQNCPAGTTTSGSNCLSCLVGSSIVGSVCLSNCPAGTTGGTVGGNPVCLTPCAAGTTPGTQAGLPVCFGPCAAGSTASGGNCLSCPAGSVISGSVCLSSCLAGTTAGTVGGNPVCLSPCAAGTPATVAGLPVCLGSCPAGSTLSGGSCLSDCAAGTTPGTSGGNPVCFAACPAGSTPDPLGTCRSICDPMTTVSQNTTTCFQACAAGSTASGGSCTSCPAGTSPFGTNQCCATPATTGTGCPANVTCTTANQYYADINKPAPARFFVFVPVDLTRAPSSVELSDPANYQQVQVNRDAPLYQPVFNKPYKNNDPTQGLAARTDCDPLPPAAPSTTCTWAKEAENFANWYTYYRTRLFSAIAVSAQSLSGLTRSPSGLDRLRLGYGSINYFPSGFSPYPNFNPFSNTPFANSFTLDGQPSDGHIVRGVRPFTEVSPPPAPGSNDRRQETFDWLFSLRAIASTPNREALDAVGRYFARTDNQGPWIQPSSPSTWSSSEASTDHVSCRRSYAILITDGEWTNAPETFGSGQQQPVLGSSQRPGNAPAALAAQGGSPLDALTTTGPLHTRSGAGTPTTYQYVPANEAQFSGGAGSTTRTLSDVAFYYWSRDLRPDLENNIKPIGSSLDIAFWQHLTPFIVGYGISASRDAASTRNAIAASTAITWDPVRLEVRPTENPYTIVTDRDATPLTCNYDPITNPSGCGRINDTFRAAVAARSDFLAATDVAGLAESIALAFARIGEVEGAATAFTGRSASIETGDRLYSASFVTNRWTGRVEAFDAIALNNAFINGTPTPGAVATSNFPAAALRNVFTSTGTSGSGTTFQYASLASAPTQLAALGSGPATQQSVVAYLRGDQSTEARNGGTFRNRADGEVMGDIVNSNPIYSKATDARYNSFRRPAAAKTGATTNASVDYPAFVEKHRLLRPAGIYVGSNSGMVHAFNASDLSERFAYVPRAVYPLLPNLTAPGYVHRYYVDGPVVEGDVYLGGAWRTMLVGTTGAGPKGVFALDITQRSSAAAQGFAASDVRWDLTGADTGIGDVQDLGHITQPGVIGSGPDGQWYYFTGNGWESQNDKATLLAINLDTGRITSYATDASGGPDPAAATLAGRPNGLGGVTPVYDGNRNIVALYGGDRHGRLWKFDLKVDTAAPTTLIVTPYKMFTAVDGSGNAQPITAAPRVTAHPLGGRFIAVGTGRLTEGADIGDTSVQTIYGLWEPRPSVAPTALTRSQLYAFTLTQTGTAAIRDRLRTLNGLAGFSWSSEREGWLVDLRVGTATLGERVIASPSEQAGFVNVTTFEPIAGGDRCQGGGASFFYRFDISGSFTRSGTRAPGGAIRPPEVVGSEYLGNIAGLRIIGQSSPKTASDLKTLDKDSLKTMLASPKKSAATDSCVSAGPAGQSIKNERTGGALAPCPSQAQRVWRELPRGRR